RLIRKAEFESLTVNDIVREAGISRATFYRHFRDKYDVMNFNYFRLLMFSYKCICTTSNVFAPLTVSICKMKDQPTQLISLFGLFII
ncbi:MAG: helix-turn-helix transcriptional regulator, partial [Clostridia bacterium]|nr:helix-turn-helix transcriptional regulator [Clostridia bacterium]